MSHAESSSESRSKRCVLVAILLTALVGCATPKEKVDLVWPPAPERPRVKYVGSISSLTDLEQSSWTRAKELMFGNEPVAEKLIKPYGVASDSRGKIFVSDTGWGLVLVFNLAAQRDEPKVVLLGMEKPGRLRRPIGLAVDSQGNLYVSDALERKIVVYGPDHKFLATIGRDDELERPAGIAIDEERRRLYVADVPAHGVKAYGLDGKLLFVFGTRGDEDGQLSFPTNVAVDKSGRVYVTDSMNNRVVIFDSEGRFVGKFGQIGNTAGSFARPKGIALDSEGHVYVVDAAFDNIQIFSRDGQLLLSFGEFGAGPGGFQLPAGICIDEKDRIYVSDQYNRRVQIFQYLKEMPEAQEVNAPGVTGDKRVENHAP